MHNHYSISDILFPFLIAMTVITFIQAQFANFWFDRINEEALAYKIGICTLALSMVLWLITFFIMLAWIILHIFGVI